MILDMNDYDWFRGDIPALTVEGEVTHTFNQPVLLYKINGEGNIKVFWDEEIYYEGALPCIFSSPIACKSLKFFSETLVNLTFIGLIAADFTWLEPYFNTTSGMTTRLSSGTDDAYYTFSSGLDKFYFNGRQVTTYDVTTNQSISFTNGGTKDRVDLDLNIYRADGKAFYIYTQTVTSTPIAFHKMRWEGYTYFSSTSSSYRLIYELFLLNNGDMILYIIQSPTTDNSYSNSLICNGTTKTLSLSLSGTTQQWVSFYPNDSEGKSWTIKYSKYKELIDATNTPQSYLLEVGNKFYKMGETALEEIPITGISASAFVEYGTSKIPVLDVSHIDPVVYSWVPQGSADATTYTTTSYPYTQEVAFSADLSDKSILGIKSVAVEHTGSIQLSHKTSRTDWSTPSEASEWVQQDLDALYTSIGTDKKIDFKVFLPRGAYFKSFTMYYINEGGEE